jgi:hypothetical protein
METSSKLMFQIADFVPQGKKLSFGEICRKFSEKTSSQSVPEDPHEVWLRCFLDLENSYGAKATIFALCFSRQGWSRAESYERLLTHIYHLCENHMFQGSWKDVAALLSIDFYSAGDYGILQEVAKQMSKEDFFGNFLPLAYRIVEKNLCLKSILKHQKELSKREKYRGIRRKVRRRGYDDKGSLRPSHKFLPGTDFSLLEKERLRQELFDSVPKLKLPKKRYWYRTLYPEDGPDSSTK